jgi:hypothetical protein
LTFEISLNSNIYTHTWWYDCTQIHNKIVVRFFLKDNFPLFITSSSSPSSSYVWNHIEIQRKIWIDIERVTTHHRLYIQFHSWQKNELFCEGGRKYSSSFHRLQSKTAKILTNLLWFHSLSHSYFDVIIWFWKALCLYHPQKKLSLFFITLRQRVLIFCFMRRTRGSGLFWHRRIYFVIVQMWRVMWEIFTLEFRIVYFFFVKILFFMFLLIKPAVVTKIIRLKWLRIVVFISLVCFSFFDFLFTL